MGSSTVKMLMVLALNSANEEYSVVVLPEPVGPVTKKYTVWAVNNRANQL